MSSDKDSKKVQRERIQRIVQELAPGKRVIFDEVTAFIRFRVVDDALEITLIESSGEWVPSVLAAKSDEEIRILIRAVSNGKI